MRSSPFAAVLAFAVLLSSTSALAADEDESSSFVTTKQPTKKVWYGWQTLAVDMPMLGLGYGLAQSESNLLPFVIGYALGGPIVHAFHGEPGRALGSFGLRLALPAALGGIAYAATSSGEDCSQSSSHVCGLGTAIVTVMATAAGIGGAVAIDSAVLARKEVPREPAVSLTPAFSTGNGRTVIGLGGTF